MLTQLIEDSLLPHKIRGKYEKVTYLPSTTPAQMSGGELWVDIRLFMLVTGGNPQTWKMGGWRTTVESLPSEEFGDKLETVEIPENVIWEY